MSAKVSSVSFYFLLLKLLRRAGFYISHVLVWNCTIHLRVPPPSSTSPPTGSEDTFMVWGILTTRACFRTLAVSGLLFWEMSKLGDGAQWSPGWI